MAEPMTRHARRRLANIRQAVRRARSRALAPVGLLVETMRVLRTRAAIAAFQQRPVITRRFAEPRPSPAMPSIVAVITHVAAPNRAKELSVVRLTQTLDSLLESLGHTQLELVINTIRDRHFSSQLPAHLRDRVVIQEREVAEPLLLGFEAQAEFIRRAETADWFLYLEDDILLDDALVLEKLSYFNAGAPSNALLVPHRYEFWQGKRTYIDLVSKASADICSWNRLTIVDVGGWKFAEFENPHSGFYALSQAQLQRWIESGRQWYGKISFVAARESAATGCLAETFRLYKPHPDNMSFLEVRHLDTKYSEEHHRRHKAAAREAT